jgi:predicted porin
VLAVADYTTWDANTPAAGVIAPDNRFRVAGTYNLGVAQLGIGYSDLKFANGGKRTETVASVTVPLGQVSLGLNLARGENDRASRLIAAGTLTDGTNEGTEAIVKYDLSKRTFLAAAYQATKVAVPVAGKTDANKFRVQIGHSF